MKKRLLAFDYGASSGRAILGTYDGEKLTLEEIHRYLNEPVMIQNSFHWDFLRLFHEMKQGMIKCANMGFTKIDGIGVDTWGVDFGLLDKQGNLIGNPYHYRDDRTVGMIEKADEKFGNEYIYNTTGIQFMPFNTLYQLLSMKLSNSSQLEVADKLLFMPDLFNYFLTGVMKAEFSITSTSALYNPSKNDWAYDLIDKIGIDKNLFAELIEAGTVLGELKDEVKKEVGIENAPVIAVAGHDTGCAVASVPVTDDRDYIYLSSGTWSLMGIEKKEPIINDKAFKINLTNEGGVAHRFRILKNIMGLWIYQECRRYWQKKGESLSFDELEDGAQKCEKFKSFINPDDLRFFGPGRMPEKIQQYCKETNQKIPETKSEIVLCVMQSLAMKYRQIANELDTINARNHNDIHMVGGGCKNVMLSQYTANATGKRVVAGPIEATATGNLVTQLIALGEVANLTEARKLVKNSFDTKVYEPENVSSWDNAYETYLKVTNQVSP